jgi:hypothetical protein
VYGNGDCYCTERGTRRDERAKTTEGKGKKEHTDLVASAAAGAEIVIFMYLSDDV